MEICIESNELIDEQSTLGKGCKLHIRQWLFNTETSVQTVYINLYMYIFLLLIYWTHILSFYLFKTEICDINIGVQLE